MVQAASPLTRAEDFRAAKHKFLSESFDSLLNRRAVKTLLLDPAGAPVDHDPGKRPASRGY